jgi:hypothetical protein
VEYQEGKKQRKRWREEGNIRDRRGREREERSRGGKRGRMTPNFSLEDSYTRWADTMHEISKTEKTRVGKERGRGEEGGGRGGMREYIFWRERKRRSEAKMGGRAGKNRRKGEKRREGGENKDATSFWPSGHPEDQS